MPPKRTWQQNQNDSETSVVRSSRESRKCNVCRRRHVKCDEQRPKCSNCAKSKAECSYSHSGMRYDHISDRQKRDDMYTEIGDISKRVDTLLVGVQNQSPIDDVARLAAEHGWKVISSPGGLKTISTNFETITQLAAVLPQALDNVYNAQTAAPLLQTFPVVTEDYSDPNVVHMPVRTSLTEYMLPHVIKPLTVSCPHLFLLLMSPPLLQRVNNHPELSELASNIHTDQSIYKCIHIPHGLFTLDVLAVSSGVTPLSDRTHMSDCTISNIYWTLVKTARLLELALYTQAYVNIGQAVSKAFTLKLHKPNPIEGLTPLEAEMLKRIFWSLWLYDTQMALLINRPPSIHLSDIHIDRPQVCEGMIEQDLHYTDCLRLIIDTRWMRIDIEHSITSFKNEKDERKLLNMIIQRVRQLRKLYEHVDDKYKVEMLTATDCLSRWQQRALYIFLLEHALNWIALFDSFLPAVPDPTMLAGTRFPDNLAISMCRQAADVITLVFERWLWEKVDCQFITFFNHLCNAVSIHKYLCRCPGVSTVHKWKAYASLQFIRTLIQRLKINKISTGERVVYDISDALVDLCDVTESAWGSYHPPELLDSMSKYFSDWRPSFDPLMVTQENTSLFANESTTMFAILDMLKAASFASTQ